MEHIRVFLVGFMGSGKTTCGKLLADYFEIPFLDQDELLEDKFGMSVPDFFELSGEENFRKIERDLLRAYDYPSSFIFSTGGGCPCFFDNIEWMNEHGMSIYLKASPSLLAQRLELIAGGRPLLKGKTPEDLKDFIENSLEFRSEFYERADVTMSINSGTDAQEIAALLSEIISLNFS